MRNSMQQAHEIVGRAMRRMARPEQRLEWLTAVWPMVVGPRVAAHTQPLAWTEDVLQIGVAGMGWKDPLNEMTGTLRRQINLWWGGEVVRQVKLVQVSSIEAGKDRPRPARKRFETDPEHTPFIRRGQSSTSKSRKGKK